MNLDDLRPNDTPAYMTPAWLGCIHHALGDEGIVAAFREDTGNQWQPGRTGLEKMIDQSCGADQAFLKAFILWVNVNLWGPLDRRREV